MAPTYFYDTSRPEVQKLWSKRVLTAHRRSSAVLDERYKFAGPDTSENHAFLIFDRPHKMEGDRITKSFSFQIADEPGVKGNQILVGKEGGIETDAFNISINKQRHAVKSEGEMNEERLPSFGVLNEGENKLTDWWHKRRAVSVVNHLCGNTNQGDDRFTGSNPVVAPDSYHIYRPNSLTTDEAVQADATAIFSPEILEEVISAIEQLDVPIVPVNIDGGEYGLCFLHDDQIYDLRKKDSTWYDTMQNGLRGGLRDKNPLFGRALGMWRGYLFFKESHITMGVHSSTGLALPNTRRAVIGGRCMLALAYGRHYRHGTNPFQWVGEDWDYKDKFGSAASLIWGCKGISVTWPDGVLRWVGHAVLTTYAKTRAPQGARNYGQPHTE